MSPLIPLLIVGGFLLMIKPNNTKAANVIKMLEGYSAFPYPDADGYSIGYGHKILPGENYDNGITIEKATELLAKDMQKAQDIINYYVKTPLDQNQLASLTSFVYNVGTTAFINSTLLKVLNSGDYTRVGEEMGRWVFNTTPQGEKVRNPGLAERRRNEISLFYS